MEPRFESVARTVMAEAGERLRATWRGSKTVHFKGAVNLVTDVDRELEALITSRLQRAFPDHLVIGEEASAEGSIARPASDRYAWYLDPIDGTTNFAHGYPQFCVSLGLARGAELLFGLVYDPLRDETFVASRGAGATLNGEPIAVSTETDLDRALVATGFPYDRREHTDFYLAFLSDFMRATQGVRRNGSAALDLCYLACGRLDGFWEWKLSPWDLAAGTLILREAGGTATDFRGQPLDLYGEQTLASNGKIHPAMLRVLAQRLGTP